MTNILILSAGTRNKIIQYFRRALCGNGKVIATDMKAIAPAIYEADQYYIVPRIDDPNYIDIILNICREEQISGVLSLIDPELSLLAANKDRFANVGVTVIGSDYDLCERAYDKMQMHRWLSEKGYRCAGSYADKDLFYSDLEAGKISFPVFVKPIRGSASLSSGKAFDKETVDFLFSHNENLMIQEFLDGQEIGADCYVDLISGELISIFTKKKLLMRAGETDKAVSFKDDRLFALIERFVNESGWRGQIDIDIFEVNGEYYISEVNPRFGGGYPHAYECGVDNMRLILNNLHGYRNEKKPISYEEGAVMMKYSDVMIQRTQTK